MPRVTASKLERVENCPGSVAGPGFDTTGPYAQRGTGVHEFLAMAMALGRDAALDEIPETELHRRLCERIDLETLPWWHGNRPENALVRIEVGFAFDPETRTARVLNSSRDYRALDEWHFGGTADAIVVTDDAVDVWDIKTGNPVAVTRAQDHPQLLSYAAMSAKAFGKTRARVGIVHIYEDGSVYATRPFELDEIDLATIEIRIVAVIERAKRAVGADDPLRYVARGPWCKYCPRFTMCPAQLAVFRAFVEAVQSGLAELEGTIKDYARVQSVPTQKPGVVYREVVGSERDIADHRVALRVLQENYGVETAQRATIAETSVGAIDNAITVYAKERGLKIAPTLREAWSVLRTAGAAANKPTADVRETKEAAA